MTQPLETISGDAATTRPSRRSIAPRWFALLFALAIGAHIVGNPPQGWVLRVATIALALAAAGLVLWPRARVAWMAAAGTVLLTAWLEAPLIGNHWLLMAVFAAATLVASLRDDPWPWLATTVRITFVSFYAFAAFAKLNTAFLDPTVSCAVFYADQGLSAWGLGSLDGASLLAPVPIVTALLVELSVPVLLLVRRTRGIGVALAATFHYAITLDIAQHFYDFTTVIFVGIFAFAADDVTAGVAGWLRRRRRVAAVTGVWLGLALAVAAIPSVEVAAMARLVVLLLWLPIGAALVWAAVRGVRRPASVALRPVGFAAVALVVVVVANGVAPYLGVKTATSWNMYANLVTVDARSNHLLVPAGAQIVDGGYVRVVATDDEDVAAYVGSGWHVPERNLRHLLAARPDAEVTFVRADGVRISGSGAELGRPMSPVVRRLLPLRSVDVREPARCQASWLPAL